MTTPPANISVKCRKCGMHFVTAPTDVDRIVKCPNGHTTVVKPNKEKEKGGK